MKYTRTIPYTRGFYNKTCISIVIPEISFIERHDKEVYYYIKNKNSLSGGFLFFYGSVKPIIEVFDTVEQAEQCYNNVLETLDKYYEQSER